MKKTTSIAILLGVALLTASCAKENTAKENTTPEPELVPINVSAVTTKTHIEGNDVRWDASGEKLKVYEYYGTGVQSFITDDGVTTDGGATMTFPGQCPQISGSDFTYYAVYPGTAANRDGNTGYDYITTPHVQYPSATSFDPDADLLIARKLETSTQAAELAMSFARVVAIGKMTLKGLVTKDNILEVAFQPKKGDEYIPLSGETSFDLETARPVFGYGDKERYTNNLMEYDGTIPANNMPVWFTCYPFELQEGDSFRVVVETVGASYNKNVTIPAGRSLAFKEGKPSVFSVNLSDASMVEKNIEAKYACLTAEEWIAFGATNDSKEVTAYQANGAIWHSYARIGNKNSLTISATSTGYLALPKLSDNLSKVRIHVASNQKSLSKVFFANTVGTASTNQYVETDKGGIYEIDLSSVNKTTGYIRCSKASINLSKIEVFTQNDTRPALATPRDVQAHLRINTQNSLSVFWSSVSDAAGYYVTITPASGTPITQYVSGKLSADFTDLPYETSFTPSVIAVPADPYTTAESGRGTGEAISTLADPDAPSHWTRVSLSQTNENDIVVIVCSNNQGDYALPNDTSEPYMVLETIPVVVRNDELKGTVPDNLKWRIADEMGDYVFYQYGSDINRLYCVNDCNGIGVGTDFNQCYEFYETEANGFEHLYNRGLRKYIGLYRTLFWTTLDQNDSDLDDQDIMIFKYRP